MSKWKPELIVLDYETALLTGEASTEFWRKDFRVESCAFTWVDEHGKYKSEFLQGEADIGDMLRKISAAQIPVWVYNIGFELGVTMCRFPGIDLLWGGDVMRLVQVYDNGSGDRNMDTVEDELDRAMAEALGEDYEEPTGKYTPGFSLAAAVKRILPADYHDHKDEAYDWIRANVPECTGRKQPGAFLNHLPYDIMVRYNIGDTENTLRLYEKIVADFAEEGYDWTRDHALYMGSAYPIVKKMVEGVPVDREKLAAYGEELVQEMADIDQTFLTEFAKEIEKIEAARAEKFIMEPKTVAGQQRRIKRLQDDAAKYKANPEAEHGNKSNKYWEKVKFNPGSTKQLAMLFVDLLGITPQFFTEKGAPAFGAAFLKQWGSGGELLNKRNKRRLVLNQVNNLLALTEYDGRWHLSLKLAGTKSGRYAGGKND